MRIIEEANPDYESCADCIHSDDSEEICVLRRCSHAVSRLKECYVPKSPTIEPQRTGKWEITDALPHNVYCSECHKRYAQTHWTVWEDGSLPRNFCPNCGAKME